MRSSATPNLPASEPAGGAAYSPSSCGFLAFGAVLCLHFPQLLTSPELRMHYPMHTMRVLIQCLIVGGIVFGVISSISS